MDYNSATKQRFKELRPGADGKLTVEWRLTDTKLLDAVKLALPPLHAIPIIFVPGIMGSNLSDMSGMPIWLLDSVRNIPVKLAWNWAPRDAGERQSILHPLRTKVYGGGAVRKENETLKLKEQDFLHRGWGEVSQTSYQHFLIWLDTKLNASRDPMAWSDFSQSSEKLCSDTVAHLRQNLQPGICMTMQGLPEIAEAGRKVEPIKSDELLKRAKSSYPVYAFGYNWLNTNYAAAILLGDRIKKVIAQNNKGPIKCTQVILVTHSMGGLVARACIQLPGMTQKVLGIVHGVMPTTGAPVAYRRCKVGMRDEDLGAGLMIGSNGHEVTAVFAQSPGALQLLPSENYGIDWLKISDPDGTTIASFPKVDPYEEIYLQRNNWWSLIKEDWLSPDGGKPIKWAIFKDNIDRAKDFHRLLAGKYHHNTFSFYGGGKVRTSYRNIVWNLKRGTAENIGKSAPSMEEVPFIDHKSVRSDGSNALFIGGSSVVLTSTRGDASTTHKKEFSHWEIHCAERNSEGDGTVPSLSGRAPHAAGGPSIRQQFELAGVQHEAAFRDYPAARIVTYYAITKLAALADRI